MSIVVVGRNELVEEDGALRAEDTGEHEEPSADWSALGRLHGHPIEGAPFDDKRGLILNEGGRVHDSHAPATRLATTPAAGSSAVLRRDRDEQERRAGERPHLFADVVQTLLEPRKPRPGDRAPARRAGVRHLTFEDWQAIDEAEVGRGEPTAGPGRVRPGRGDARHPGEKVAGFSPRWRDLEELEAMIEAALPGAEVEVVDETAAATTSGDRRTSRSSRASRESTSTGSSRRRSRSGSTTARSTPLSVKT